MPRPPVRPDVPPRSHGRPCAAPQLRRAVACAQADAHSEALPVPLPDDLRAYLVDAHLAGEVQTSPGETVANCRKLAAGHDDYTFGLSDWQAATDDDAIAAVADHCGERAVDGGRERSGWIDPDATLDGLAAHARLLVQAARDGARVLAMTGHPTGLLHHYVRLVTALSDRGCEILLPYDDQWVGEEDGQRRGVRFVGGVGCVWTGGDLAHSHRPLYAEAMLRRLDDADGPPDLVIGDHGMAGAAIERSIPTASIADVNDPALIVAQANGRTDGVLVIDDNLAPRRYEPVTRHLLDALP